MLQCVQALRKWSSSLVLCWLGGSIGIHEDFSLIADVSVELLERFLFCLSVSLFLYLSFSPPFPFHSLSSNPARLLRLRLKNGMLSHLLHSIDQRKSHYQLRVNCRGNGLFCRRGINCIKRD